MRVLGGGARRELAAETLLLIAFAAWGVAIAISLLPLWEGPAPAGQLPGFATKENLDAHAPLRFVLGLIVIPLVLPFALRPLARRLLERRLPAGRYAGFQPAEDTPCRQDAGGTAGWKPALPVIASIAIALWYVAIARDPWWVTLPTIVVIAISLLRVDLRWTRFDWILLPAIGTTVMALIDVTPLAMHQVVIVALLIVFALRVAVACIPSPIEPALAFLVTPLALALQTSFFARDQRYFGWHALAIVAISPFIVRVVLRNRRRALRLLAFVIYPIAVYSYMNATSMLTAEGKPRVAFFEDSHSLMPVNEYLRGERPYRDVLPVHGLGEDGLLDFIGARLRGTAIGDVIAFRATVGMLNAIAVYALGFALTGIAETGVLAFFLWLLTSATTTIRVLPALLTLAVIAFAVRQRRPRWLIVAAIGCVVCGMTSLDYAFYTTLILLLAAWRMRAFRFAITGLFASGLILFLVFALFGIAGDFVRSTFIDVLSMGSAYTLDPFHAPASFVAAFPEVLSALLKPDAFPYIAWVIVLIATAVAWTRPRRRRFEPLLLTGMWIVLAAISYGERHHLYFRFALPALAIAATWIAWRRRRVLAYAMTVILLIVAIPTTHVAVVGWMRGSRGPIENGWIEVPEIPRARHALFSTREAAELRAVKEYVDTLAPNETFFDFTNRGAFYYLTNRDCPIRQVEVAYYETEARQRAVIDVFRTNPNIRAALVPDAPGAYAVDGVPNRDRAPLVWQYLEQNFEPAFAREGAVFWRRK